jgi:hypothetical protein
LRRFRLFGGILVELEAIAGRVAQQRLELS